MPAHRVRITPPDGPTRAFVGGTLQRPGVLEVKLTDQDEVQVWHVPPPRAGDGPHLLATFPAESSIDFS